jgi:alginate O-acetyltransferase complex protein AlgI
MLFPTFKFLIFFCVVFAVYWSLTRHRLRMGWLLLASCVFYMSWNPWLILLILLSASVDYCAALCLEKTSVLWARRLLLFGSIGFNLGILALFKYVNFFLDTAGSALSVFGVQGLGGFLELTLPLGISFYTFETISYIVDVYRGRTKAVRNLLDYALFILFFPHLVAGPIVRAKDFLPQVERIKRFNWDRLYLGVRFVLRGFVKKAVISDTLAQVVDPVFADAGLYASSALWLAVFAYAVQVYCDFSGYSDMALGLAHMLGFKLPLNFNYPYLATNLADFWRRWHISLSSWLRDYLFIPLGGSRGGAGNTCRNVMLVMVICGLWHGASWTFIVFGICHGLLLSIHRLVPWPKVLGRPALRPLCMMTTFTLVCLSYVIFRAQTIADAGTILSHMLWPVSGQVLAPAAVWLVIFALALTLVEHLLGSYAPAMRLERWLPAPVMGAGLAAALLIAIVLFPENTKAFIYFQF